MSNVGLRRGIMQMPPRPNWDEQLWFGLWFKSTVRLKTILLLICRVLNIVRSSNALLIHLHRIKPMPWRQSHVGMKTARPGTKNIQAWKRTCLHWMEMRKTIWRKAQANNSMRNVLLQLDIRLLTTVTSNEPSFLIVWCHILSYSLCHGIHLSMIPNGSWRLLGLLMTNVFWKWIVSGDCICFQSIRRKEFPFVYIKANSCSSYIGSHDSIHSPLSYFAFRDGNQRDIRSIVESSDSLVGLFWGFVGRRPFRTHLLWKRWGVNPGQL
jgi:hypothetical protein